MRALYINICTQPTSAVILFLAKSDKIFQDPIMAEQSPCFQPGFDFLSVENSDHIKFYFLKGINKLVPRALFSYISTREFLRTLEKCEKHSP